MKLKVNKKMIALALASTLVLSNNLISDAKEIADDQICSVNEDTIQFKHVIEATSNVYLRALPDVESKAYGIMPKGSRIDKLSEYGDFYAVFVNGVTAYVSKDYSKEIIEQVVINTNNPIKKLVYITQDTPIYSEETRTREIGELPKYEVCEVYDELKDTYQVKTPDYEGYVAKNACLDLPSKCVVVDVSDQNVKLYDNNEVVLESPVVTGGPKHETNIGYHNVLQIRNNTYLKGPSWNCHVDVFAKFDEDSEGLHDASWRKEEEFGGDTYLTNGSHGCVNMPTENAKALVKQLQIGDTVIVKR